MSKKALIFGINGMDGSHLAELLLEKGYEVYGTIRTKSNTHNIEHIIDDINVSICDITNYENVHTVISETNPDEIYNLAADSSSGGGWSTSISTTLINGQSVVYILESILKQSKQIKLFHASSSEIFKGHPHSTVINEILSQPRPTTPYGASKLFAQNMVTMYREQYKMYACSGILFTHESERRNPKFLFRKITQNVARIAKGEIQSFTLGDLNSKRDWGASRDYVNAMWLMLQQKEPRDFVISSGYLRTIRDICKMAFEVIGITDWERYVIIDEKYSHPNDSALIGDNSRICKYTGWYPTTRMEELVNEMVNHDLNSIK